MKKEIGKKYAKELEAIGKKNYEEEKGYDVQRKIGKEEKKGRRCEKESEKETKKREKK